MDFHQRLQKAIERGERNRDARLREEAERAMSEEECRRLHSQYRLELTDQIEACLRQLVDHFPGFKFATVMGESGWGASISRDDLLLQGRRRTSVYSRLEMLVRPYGKYQVLDLAAKGTIRNKEVYNRNHYERLSDVDLDTFNEMIDLWVLEYAEQYAGTK